MPRFIYKQEGITNWQWLFSSQGQRGTRASFSEPKRILSQCFQRSEECCDPHLRITWRSPGELERKKMPVAMPGLLPWQPRLPQRGGYCKSAHSCSRPEQRGRQGIIANGFVQIHHFKSSFLTCVFDCTQNMAFWFPLPLFHFRI